MEEIAKQSKKQMYKVILSTITGNLGSGILTFIIGLLILRHTSSALSFGVSQVIGPVVALILLPFTGSIVDRFDRKKIVIYAQLLSIVSLVLYAIAIYYQGFNQLIYTYLLLICLRISDLFLTTSLTSSVLHIVVEEDIQKLKSFQQMIASLTAIIAPIFGALLLDILPLVYLVLLESAIELITILIVVSLDFRLVEIAMEEEAEEKTQSILKMFQQGLVFVKKSRKLVFALFFSMLVNFVFGLVAVGLPYIQIEVLHFSNNIYGITEAIFSFGMVLSAILLSMSKTIQFPLFHSWSMINNMGILFLFLGVFLVFPFEQVYFILGIALFNLLAGLLITRINVPVTIWLTKEVPSHFQGRVFNILNTGAQLLSPIGILCFSGFFDIFGSASIFMVAGGGVILIALLYPLIFKVDLKSTGL
ncbi:MFS transporter [Listeria aquatica]|uniref:MFS transporter n=1 Tax=Listeria aquatica TaxID=1494960 RepID=A0A841ZL30_9LIST|nr:MFS transporter [Listeria aquatica]MBC1520232.1 MFS transporter [Listeria aquatica]